MVPSFTNAFAERTELDIPCSRGRGKSPCDRGIRTAALTVLVFALLLPGLAFAADESDFTITTTTPGAAVNVERVINDTKVMVSVIDAANTPLLGLSGTDFAVTAGGRTANIVSAQPVSESLDVPLTIVMVLDNSFSMVERNAVRPLLAGVDELLKIVRPIDTVKIVVFDGSKTEKISGRDLHVRTFISNKPDELRDFVSEVYGKETSSITVLYEGMLAGLALIGEVPENQPKFMVVFSDGEDLNSSVWKKDVVKEAEGKGRFNAYAIDYMPGKEKDEFLTTFAESNRGEIWKATSETNLVPIFQSVASKMQYFYVVSYLFPMTGTLGVAPTGVTIDEVHSFDAARSEEPSVEGRTAPEQEAPSVVSRIDSSAVTLSPVVDSVYGIAGWTATLANADGTLAVQSGEGSLPAEIVMPLATDDLGRFADGGAVAVSVEVRDAKGQTLLLTGTPVTINRTKTTGSLTISPTRVTVDQVEAFDASSAEPSMGTSIVSRIDASELTLHPVVDAPYGIARWKVSVTNADRTLALQAGEGAPPKEVSVPLQAEDLGRLAVGGDITATMELQDSKGQNLVLTSSPVRVEHFMTTGSLKVSPPEVTIEEVKTIDSSPMLGYIYFEEDKSEIPDRYLRLAGPEETTAFQEQRYHDTLEKYYQVLNIVGKRLAEHPEAVISLVGCNAHYGPEKGNRKLSAARVESVRQYLKTVWGIGPERIKVEARNLPAMPSTSRIEEGRADNRRVEIQSEDPAVTGLIRSTYLAMKVDTRALMLSPYVKAPHGAVRWAASLSNSRSNLGGPVGDGPPPVEIAIPMRTENLRKMAEGGHLVATVRVEDGVGQELSLRAAPVKVNFIQTSQRMAQKEGFLVQEKYALILFDFDSDAIDAGNKAIVDSIVARIKELPRATVDIVGHTDNIGKEDYNIKLSERRALAVYKLITESYGQDAGERIQYRGVGPNDPLYENTSSEARAFNRTVTITLEYMAED